MCRTRRSMPSDRFAIGTCLARCMPRQHVDVVGSKKDLYVSGCIWSGVAMLMLLDKWEDAECHRCNIR